MIFVAKCPYPEGPFPVYFPHEDCRKFWQCGNGFPYLMTCAPGTQFNPRLNACDYPRTAECNSENYPLTTPAATTNRFHPIPLSKLTNFPVVVCFCTS